jgi:tRNA/tmRNA/rRNA uracil-C5-methylase (TrmA/RlmC/RlmD family)
VILTVGAPAAGGACVARAADGRVVFVRHALPGETVRVEVTSDGAKFLRADAVEVLEPSPDRVEPPCPYARPRRCGGCDWQHASPAAQLAVKTALVEEQLRRVGRFAWEGSVEAVEPLLGWRTRVQWAIDAAGTPGLHKHRSSELEPVETCLIAASCTALSQKWPGYATVEEVSTAGQTVLVAGGVSRPAGVRVEVLGRSFEVAGGQFWQVHVEAPRVLGLAVLEGLAPQRGESVADLYAGVGLFASLLGAAVGPGGSGVAYESSSRAAADAARNTADQPGVKVRTAPVTEQLVSRLKADLVVLDPPRAGAGPQVSAALARRRPRAVAYVSCDAASFARDLRVFLDKGWSVASLRAFDLYPQTEHVELVTILSPPAEGPAAHRA